MLERAASRRMDQGALEDLYSRYNRRRFVHPDPLEFLYEYPDLPDREIAGLVAALLAYGKVTQILRSVSIVLGRMGSPAAFLRRASAGSLLRTFSGFKHRFTTGEHLARALLGAKRMIEREGSLGACFMSGLRDEDETVVPALSAFMTKMMAGSGGGYSSLLTSPERGSACKRLNLFLRWMVRRDRVDPGGWDAVPASKLVVPLDTHLFRISRTMGLTDRRVADLRTALGITAAFRTVAPEDPVRYDFALTRLGIRGEQGVEAVLSRCSAKTTFSTAPKARRSFESNSRCRRRSGCMR